MPYINLPEGMLAEHTGSPDSDWIFVASNYGTPMVSNSQPDCSTAVRWPHLASYVLATAPRTPLMRPVALTASLILILSL